MMRKNCRNANINPIKCQFFSHSWKLSYSAAVILYYNNVNNVKRITYIININDFIMPQCVINIHTARLKYLKWKKFALNSKFFICWWCCSRCNISFLFLLLLLLSVILKCTNEWTKWKQNPENWSTK